MSATTSGPVQGEAIDGEAVASRLPAGTGQPAQHGLTAHGHGAGVPAASRAEWLTSFDPADFPIPTGREEDWRFTPMERLRDLHTGAPAEGPAPTVTGELPGLRLESVPRDDDRLGRTGTPQDRVAAQAWAGFDQATVVTVPKGALVEEPGHLLVQGQGGLAYGHLAVLAEQESSAVVVLDHRGTGALAANVELDLADGAQLTVVSLQDWDPGAVHVAAHHARLGRDARLRHIVVTFGGDLVRITPSARFTGPNGDLEMLGLYFADAGQHQEHRLFVDHAMPHCRSNVEYKGALQGESAHTVWIGDVLIRAEAVGTDTYELNRNLVLTQGARADSVPNLEIETGEIVGAGHASATGRFDDEQLFYLQARGIPADEARRLVVRGFFAGLIQQIGVPAIQDRLLAAVDAELSRSMAAAGPVTR